MGKPWQVWKDFIYPGTVRVPADGGLASYTFTPADVRSLTSTGNAKVRDGWQIPLCWEHQDVTPEKVRLSRGERDRDFARGVFGRIEKFDLTPDGRGKVLLAGEDPEDLRQLHKVRFVSPEIQWDWTDTDGRTWRGPTVTHLAATPRPVQRHQHPVGADPDPPHPRLAPAGTLENLVRMSLSAGAKTAPGVGRRLRLALDHYAGNSGEPPMADATEATGGPGDDGKAKQTPWQRCAEALAKVGVKIGDGSNIKDPDHFADLIEVACMNSEAADDGMDELDDLPPEEPDGDEPPGDLEAPPEGAAPPAPPPLQMSQRGAEKLVDMHRAELVRRAEALVKTRRVPPSVGNDLVAKAKKVKLSLAANAELAPNGVSAAVATYEKLPANGAWSPGGKTNKPAAGGKKARLSQTAAAEPSPYDVTDSPEDDDAVVGAFESAVGRPSN